MKRRLLGLAAARISAMPVLAIEPVTVDDMSGKRNTDGPMTIRFGGDPKAPNHLRITPGRTYMARLYRLRVEVLSGQWTFPEAVPVR